MGNRKIVINYPKPDLIDEIKDFSGYNQRRRVYPIRFLSSTIQKIQLCIIENKEASGIAESVLPMDRFFFTLMNLRIQRRSFSFNIQFEEETMTF